MKPTLTGRQKRRIAGQSLTEFTVAMAMLLSVVLTTFLFLAVFLGHGWRILHLIGLEYP